MCMCAYVCMSCVHAAAEWQLGEKIPRRYVCILCFCVIACVCAYARVGCVMFTCASDEWAISSTCCAAATQLETFGANSASVISLCVCVCLLFTLCTAFGCIGVKKCVLVLLRALIFTVLLPLSDYSFSLTGETGLCSRATSASRSGHLLRLKKLGKLDWVMTALTKINFNCRLFVMFVCCLFFSFVK